MLIVLIAVAGWFYDGDLSYWDVSSFEGAVLYWLDVIGYALSANNSVMWCWRLCVFLFIFWSLLRLAVMVFAVAMFLFRLIF